MQLKRTRSQRKVFDSDKRNSTGNMYVVGRTGNRSANVLLESADPAHRHLNQRVSWKNAFRESLGQAFNLVLIWNELPSVAAVFTSGAKWRERERENGSTNGKEKGKARQWPLFKQRWTSNGRAAFSCWKRGVRRRHCDPQAVAP